jgi:hypothetical protein
MMKAAADQENMEERATDVRIRFMGEFKALIDSPDIRVSMPRGASMRDLLVALSRKYGDGFSKWIFTGAGDLHHWVLIFVNGENIQDTGGLDAKLGTHGDQVEIILLPMFEGG